MTPDAHPEAPWPTRLVLHGPADPRRAEVEALIRCVFADRFGARLTDFAPTLVSLQSGGRILAAAGYRCAADGPLFLERYLSAPVQQVLAQAGEMVPRSQVVEVGHFAAARAGAGLALTVLLGQHLREAGFGWVASTVTRELHRLFVRAGVRPRLLGAADPAALGAAAGEWGSYYAHAPLVLAGELPQALAVLRPQEEPMEALPA